MSFLLAISVGNTRTAVGHFHVQVLANGDVPAIVAAAVAQWEHEPTPRERGDAPGRHAGSQWPRHARPRVPRALCGDARADCARDARTAAAHAKRVNGSWNETG